MPPWLADLARQAERISREMQPAVEMMQAMEPYVRQASETAAFQHLHGLRALAEELGIG